MATNKLFDLKNEFDSALIVDLEPVPETYMLEPQGYVEIISLEAGSSVTLKVGKLENGQPYISIWPDKGDIRIERGGRDVFQD